jgi:hypothetical protein
MEFFPHPVHAVPIFAVRHRVHSAWYPHWMLVIALARRSEQCVTRSEHGGDLAAAEATTPTAQKNLNLLGFF